MDELSELETRRCYRQLAEQFVASLAEEEGDACYAYSEPEVSELVNEHLRGVGDPALREQAEDWIALLDSALAKAPLLPVSLLVYRGFARAGHEWRVGASFSEPGFCSTTIGRAYAGRFAERAEGGEQLFVEIALPRGTKVAPLQELAEYPSEEEILLPHGSSFEVVSLSGSCARLRLLVG